MRSLGIRRVAVNMDSNFSHCDSPSSSGECKNDKLFSDTVPLDETTQKDDIFETQVVDYDDDDDDGGTQPVEFNEETQIMDLAGETQIMDEYDDFAGGTQLLVISNSETEFDSDRESAGKTQVLDDTVHLNDIQIPDTIDNQTNAGENMNSHCRRDDGGARPNSPPSVDVTQRSGSLRRGFASVRTASLRAAGLAARKMASENAENGSCSNVFSRGSSKCHFVNNDAICTGGRVDLENDMEKHDANGLCNSHRSDVARSLARKLFMEEDVAEEGSNKDLDLRVADISQLPGRDNDLTGLSYVDSQEPGELSQANALEFVDRFLMVNVLEPDKDVVPKNAVCETVTPGSFKKGVNSIARDANYRSSVASPSVFEWDDKVEDEGGGEFFIKKRELLFGNRRMVRNSCDKTRSSRHSEIKVSVKGRKAGKFDEIDIENKDDDYKDRRSHLDTCYGMASDVGIDTQMAAEAMEALSTATDLVENSSRVSDKGLNNVVDGGERRDSKTVPKKRSTAQKRAYTSNSGVVTRSQRKLGEECEYSLALRPRSQHLTKELQGDLVKPRVKRSRLSVNNTAGDHKKVSSDRELWNADGMGAENNLEGELNQSVAVKRQSLRKKQSTLMSVQKNTLVIGLNQLDDANGTLDDFRERKHCVYGVQTRKRKTRSDTASGSPNARVETENLTIAGDEGRDLQQTCDQDTGSGKSSWALTSYGPCEVTFGSIARRTRSKRSAQSAQCLGDAKGVQSSVILSSGNAFKLSLEKKAACSSSDKGTSADVSLGGSCRKTQELSYPADITPNNLKTPEHAVSPICMGDEYRTPSCKKNLFLKKECYKLTDSDDHYSSPFRVLRQRRDMNNVRVLFSQHLDEDIVKQQKKILSRLGFCEASSILEATHFVADMFVRTRNMLEAIANAKLVVTHLWLESCGQADCFIDEKNFILRDTKKEKELGFSMPMSLARASRHPILEGRKVLVTPNIKPSKDLISSLVKAVHGQAIGRMCRATSNMEKLLDDLLILSCEEDYEVCLPLLEKGISVYSSELLLNGIITQRLEYERHRLFGSHVTKTRSSLRLKKEGEKLIRVPKTN